MLQAILDSILESDPVSDPVERLLSALLEGPRSAAQIMAQLGLSHRSIFRQRYLRPAMDAGVVELNQTDKPNTENQGCRPTRG